MTTRALVVHGAGDVRLAERPAPVPGPGEVAVRIAYGGICGSDLHHWRHGRVGDARVREPLVLGHEVVGTVAAGGPALATFPPTPTSASGAASPPRSPARRSPEPLERAAVLGAHRIVVVGPAPGAAAKGVTA